MVGNFLSIIAGTLPYNIKHTEVTIVDWTSVVVPYK